MDGSSISGTTGNPGAGVTLPPPTGQEGAKIAEGAAPDHKTGSQPVIGLKHGQLLRATVLELISSHEVLLGMFGTTTTVRSNLPLQVGQELMLEVIAHGDQILLRAKGASGSLLEKLALPELFRLEKGLQGLEQGFEKLLGSPMAKLFSKHFSAPGSASDGSPKLPDPEGIKAFHEQLGLNFERRLLDLPKLEATARRSEVKLLKLTLRSLDAVLGKAEAAAGETSKSQQLAERGVLAEVLQQAEAWRGEQLARSEAGLPLVYPLPNWPGMQDGRLYLLKEDGAAEDRRQEGRENTENFTLIFLLELESLGSLRIDVSMQGADACLRFHCLRESSVQRLHSAMDSLRTSFEEVGLRLVSSKVKWSRRSLPVLDLLPPRPSGTAVFDMEL